VHPLLQRLRDDMNLLAFENLTQLLAIQPARAVRLVVYCLSSASRSVSCARLSLSGVSTDTILSRMPKIG